jgi:Domain of unknown function (DUF1707)
VIDLLKAAFVQGRLARDEFDERVGQVLVSRTYGELAAVTADIPADLVGALPRRPPVRARRRIPFNTAVTAGACVAGLVNVGLLATLLSGSGVAVVLFVVFTIVGTILAIWTMVVAPSSPDRLSPQQLSPEQPAQRDRKLLLPPLLVVAADPFLMPVGEPRLGQPLRPLPGGPPEAGLERARREVMRDAGRTRRAADLPRDDAGAERGHRADQVRAPLPRGDGPDRTVGEASRDPRPGHRAEPLVRPRDHLVGDEAKVGAEAPAVVSGQVLLGAQVGPGTDRAQGMVQADQQDGRDGVGLDGRLRPASS